jgi:hypothetical protein
MITRPPVGGPQALHQCIRNQTAMNMFGKSIGKLLEEGIFGSWFFCMKVRLLPQWCASWPVGSKRLMCVLGLRQIMGDYGRR